MRPIRREANKPHTRKPTPSVCGCAATALTRPRTDGTCRFSSRACSQLLSKTVPVLQDAAVRCTPRPPSRRGLQVEFGDNRSFSASCMLFNVWSGRSSTSVRTDGCKLPMRATRRRALETRAPTQPRGGSHVSAIALLLLQRPRHGLRPRRRCCPLGVPLPPRCVVVGCCFARRGGPPERPPASA